MSRTRYTSFQQAAPALARDLLGKILVHQTDQGPLAGRIVEVEAYLGAKDPASHGYRGITSRNRIMYGPGGYVYIYQIYGLHFCINVTADPPGESAGVLLRALEPLEGIAHMREQRNKHHLHNLCSGPAKLFQALDLHPDMYGHDLLQEPLYIDDDGFVAENITQTTRVGISKAKDMQLRWYLTDSPYISRR